MAFQGTIGDLAVKGLSAWLGCMGKIFDVKNVIMLCWTAVVVLASTIYIDVIWEMKLVMVRWFLHP
jgi:hypothetical protein